MRKMHAVFFISWLILTCCSCARHSEGTLSFVCYCKEAGVGYGVCVDKDYAYVTNNDGVVIFDVRQPKNPRKISMITSGVTFGICIENNLAYILGRRGLVIADVSDPVNPKKIQEYVIEGLKEVSERCLQRVPVMRFNYKTKELEQEKDENGNDVWKFDSQGSNKAFELLGKHLGLYTDKFDHTSKGERIETVAAMMQKAVEQNNKKEDE